MDKGDCFLYILGFSLSVNTWFNFVFVSFFRQDHLLNFGSGFSRGRDCCRPKSDRWFFFWFGPFHAGDFGWGAGAWLVSGKGEALWVELNLRVEACGSSYFDISYFLQCFYSVLVAKNHHWSRFLVDEYSFTYIF